MSASSELFPQGNNCRKRRRSSVLIVISCFPVRSWGWGSSRHRNRIRIASSHSSLNKGIQFHHDSNIFDVAKTKKRSSLLAGPKRSSISSNEYGRDPTISRLYQSTSSLLGLRNGKQFDERVGSTKDVDEAEIYFGSLVPSEDENMEDANDETKSWLQWFMIGCKPRGTNRVIMREAEELGGVPRGDRYSSRDWFHNTVTLPNSAILRSIRSPVLAMTSWATFLSLLHHSLLRTKFTGVAQHMYLPGSPHSLMMSALGLLLVFRTNSAYQRFSEGRVIWERIINTSRDLSRMMILYNDEIGVEKRRRLQKLLVAFPYLLRHRIRPSTVMRRLGDENHERDPKHTILLYQDSGPKDNDLDAAMLAKVEEETGKSRRKKRQLFWVDKRTLPWRLVPPGALEKLCRAQNRPLWICDRMAKELKDVPDQSTFTSRERLTLLKSVDELSKCIGGAERIHQTMVPLNYARHTLRALTLFLFSLPFTLVKDLRLMTGPMVFLVSWLLFGVYEIGYAIEDPFQGTLRLSIMCDTVRRDVIGDEIIRGSAFQLEVAHCTTPIVYNDDDEQNDVPVTVSTPQREPLGIATGMQTSAPAPLPLGINGDEKAYQ